MTEQCDVEREEFLRFYGAMSVLVFTVLPSGRLELLRVDRVRPSDDFAGCREARR